jgi:hypothetical protein
MHSKIGHKLCPWNDHSNIGRFGIRMFTVCILFAVIENLLNQHLVYLLTWMWIKQIVLSFTESNDSLTRCL